MFECDVDRDEGSVKLKRRAFLLTSVSAVAGLAVWSMRKPRLAEAHRIKRGGRTGVDARAYTRLRSNGTSARQARRKSLPRAAAPAGVRPELASGRSFQNRSAQGIIQCGQRQRLDEGLDRPPENARRKRRRRRRSTSAS